ncbi:MAG: hypothetical protein JWP38_1300 [Herbaspirillum sp.]|jgi:hypothetical protein|nr:hypothetical protein [Herbaspirillum sp.]
MDEIVAQSLKKWPNVPHCYGWLALDARGCWRMRDQDTQNADLAGDKIAHAALIGFINRNYDSDEKGRWYFQNGPQRVYVNLEIAPYIARTDPQQGFLLHTGQALDRIDAAWLSDSGRLLLHFSDSGRARIAALDDRDLAQCLPALRIGDAPVGDLQLMAWMEGNAEPLSLAYREQRIPVDRIAQEDVAGRFGFTLRPQPDSAPTERNG